MLGACDLNTSLVSFELYKIFIMQITALFMLHFMHIYFEENIEARIYISFRLLTLYSILLPFVPFYFPVSLVNET